MQSVNFWKKLTVPERFLSLCSTEGGHEKAGCQIIFTLCATALQRSQLNKSKTKMAHVMSACVSLDDFFILHL